MRHFASTLDLTDAELSLILEEARSIVSENRWNSLKGALNGTHIVLAFFEPSTRTRLSFELAAHRLGATTVHMQSEGSSIVKGESLENTIETISAMKYDAIVMRHASNGSISAAINHTSMPVINAGEGSLAHPTQGLLDASALLEKFGSLDGRKICLVGDVKHSRVARSQVDVCSRLGAEFALCCPEQFLPDVNDTLFATMKQFDNINDALQWADVASMLRIQRERFDSTEMPDLEDYKSKFSLDSSFLIPNSELVVLHPGPVNVGVELDEQVLNSPNSLINRQVTHGVAVRMAVLKFLLSIHPSPISTQ